MLSFYFSPDVGPGPLRAAALTHALLAAEAGDVSVDVLTTMPNRYRSMKIPAEAIESEDRLSIRRFAIPTHRSGMLDQSRAFQSYARQVLRFIRRGRWDVVVATSSRLMTAALGVWVGRAVEAKTYLDIRDLFTDTMNDVIRTRMLRSGLPAIKALEKWTLRSADRINVVSAGFTPHIQAVAQREDLRTYTNGIDKEFLNLNFLKSARSAGEPLRIVYGGNIGEGQGLESILPPAARRLGNEVSIQCFGDGGRRRVLERELYASGVNSVEVLDPVPRDMLLDNYRKADVLFLHLNDYAAFRKVLPSKLFEYAATGKRILAGVGGYAAEFLEEEVSGVELFAPCDVEGMIEALERLRDWPESIDRTEFCRKYDRETIMRDMASDIIALGSE